MSCYKCNNGHREVPNHYTDEPEIVKCDCGDKMDDQLKKDLEEKFVEKANIKETGEPFSFIEYDADFLKWIEQKIKGGAELLNKWIKIGDKLPDNEERVAVLYRYKDNSYLTKWIGEYDPRERRWRSQLDDVEILYWMPLPDEPKDGE